MLTLFQLGCMNLTHSQKATIQLITHRYPLSASWCEHPVTHCMYICIHVRVQVCMCIYLSKHLYSAFKIPLKSTGTGLPSSSKNVHLKFGHLTTKSFHVHSWSTTACATVSVAGLSTRDKPDTVGAPVSMLGVTAQADSVLASTLVLLWTEDSALAASSSFTDIKIKMW